LSLWCLCAFSRSPNIFDSCPIDGSITLTHYLKQTTDLPGVLFVWSSPISPTSLTSLPSQLFSSPLQLPCFYPVRLHPTLQCVTLHTYMQEQPYLLPAESASCTLTTLCVRSNETWEGSEYECYVAEWLGGRLGCLLGVGLCASCMTSETESRGAARDPLVSRKGPQTIVYLLKLYEIQYSWLYSADSDHLSTLVYIVVSDFPWSTMSVYEFGCLILYQNGQAGIHAPPTDSRWAQQRRAVKSYRSNA
jgi:hypothetical protein